MSTQWILVASMSIGMAGWGLLLAHYAWPHLQRLPRSEALAWLIAPHIFRYIGLAFLVNGVTAQPLDPRFADPAAYGDLLAAILALVAVRAQLAGWRSATAWAWIFNLEGFLDLINAVVRGLLYTDNGHLGAAFFIPAMIVPFLLGTHVQIFRLLVGQIPAHIAASRVPRPRRNV